MLISVVVPMFNAIAVITLELFSGKRPNALGIIIDVFKNPLILGTVVGIAFQLLGIHLPEALLSTIKRRHQPHDAVHARRILPVGRHT